jgi:hypothetical protein
MSSDGVMKYRISENPGAPYKEAAIGGGVEAISHWRERNWDPTVQMQRRNHYMMARTE